MCVTHTDFNRGYGYLARGVQEVSDLTLSPARCGALQAARHVTGRPMSDMIRRSIFMQCSLACCWSAASTFIRVAPGAGVDRPGARRPRRLKGAT